jgi:hypothetical protein
MSVEHKANLGNETYGRKTSILNKSIVDIKHIEFGFENHKIFDSSDANLAEYVQNIYLEK